MSVLVQFASADRILRRSLTMDPTHLDIESRECRDTDGGGRRVQIRDARPNRRKADGGRTVILMMQQMESPCAELSIRGDAGRWRAAECSIARLRELVAEAQVRASQPMAD